MLFKRILIAVLLGLIPFQSVAFSQDDEQTIREIFEKTSGRKIFSLTISPIKEGLTNRNFKVLFDGTPFFVRLGHKDPQSLRIDRVKELSLYRLAEKDGIAPRLMYSDAKAGNLIAPFIQGTAYGKKDGRWLYERTESIHKIVTLLKRCHSHLSPVQPGLDYPFMIINAYIQQALSASIPLPKDIDHAIEIVRNLKSQIPQQQSVLCHQDLVPDNFIFDGKRLYLVDWEYAEWSDPFFDFTALCIEHQFDEEEKNMVLKQYFQTPTEEQRIHLEMMCMLYSLRDALWYFIENDPSPQKKCDYLGLANFHYQNFYASEQWLLAHHIPLSGANV